MANQILKMDYHDDGLTSLQRIKKYKEESMKKSATMNKSKSRTGCKLYKFTPLLIFIKFLMLANIDSQVLTGGEEIGLPSSNYKISQLKYRISVILNHLLNGYNERDYIYYLYRREIDPKVFRKNFAYQYFFFTELNNAEYRTRHFFQYNLDLNAERLSPYIVEIGFQLFFLLK
jgi:hypothetical protein